ncbi:MAG: hypothetical protein QOI48_4126 [Solirubrobacteraceae bacterium]|nr:hypothetical protein [Solirubrobacteraceae bacterium]
MYDPPEPTRQLAEPADNGPNVSLGKYLKDPRADRLEFPAGRIQLEEVGDLRGQPEQQVSALVRDQLPRVKRHCMAKLVEDEMLLVALARC